MEIILKTKYDPGQRVYWMGDNLIKSGIIYQILFGGSKIGVSEVDQHENRYLIEVDGTTISMEKGEKVLFGAKEDIIQSLLKACTK